MRKIRRTSLVGTVALGAALASGPAFAAPPRLQAGVFLYASPSLGDPNFAESVVLLLQHGAEGSMGVVIDRPTRVPVGEAVRELAEIRGLELSLYWGGPVQPEVALALVRSAKGLRDAQRALPGVYLSAEPARWREVARGAEAESRLRVYAGYAGWGPGQLAAEMRRGAWVVGPAEAAAVFSAEPSGLWPKVHELLRRIEAGGPGVTTRVSAFATRKGGGRSGSP